MLQKFLRRGKKNVQTNLVPISGRVAVLNLEFAHGRSEVQPTVENLPKDRHGSGGFLRWNFWSQKCKRKNPRKKIRRKIRHPKTKNPPAHDPPEIRSSARPTNPLQTYQQIRLSNLQVQAGFLSIEKDCSWRRLQSMDSGTLFGCLLGMVEAPMLTQLLLVGWTRFAAHPSKQHF